MFYTTNECVDCESHMRACYACDLRKVEHLACDICGRELTENDAHFTIDGEDYCEDCAFECITENYSKGDIIHAVLMSE